MPSFYVPLVSGPILAGRTDPHGSGKLGFNELRQLWIEEGGPGGVVADTAAAIALAESGGNPNAVNSIGATGAWQIHPGGPQFKNPRVNAREAVRKYRAAGNKFTPWTTFTGADTPGHVPTYKKYLPKTSLPGTAIPGGQDVVNAAGAAGSAVNSVGNFLGTLSSALFSAEWWMRALLVIGGAIAIGLGVYFIGREFVTEQARKFLK